MSRFRVSASRECVRIDGAPLQTVRFMADRLFMGLPRLPRDRCMDLLHIATGAYAVDRLVRRPPQRSRDGCVRSFELTVAVSEPEFWSDALVAQRVNAILRFLTGDEWVLSFEPAARDVGRNGYQLPLHLRSAREPERVALYSGGLDSAAGLANRVVDGVNDYVLVTVGHQSGIRRRAIAQVQSLHRALGIEPFPHATMLTSLHGGTSIRLSQQECTQRSRAFLFAACAVAVADAYRIGDIDVFENGVGSINLPLMTGMLGQGLATRGSHPQFLALMGALAVAMTESNVRFTLPFALMTKGEMLGRLVRHGLNSWARWSRSCIHSSWRLRGAPQCGSCPACIERRQALRVAGVSEDPDYSTDLFSDRLRIGADRDYFMLYRDDARSWLSGDSRPRRRMDAHLRLTGVPDRMHPAIMDLQERHSREVSAVFG